MALRTCPECGGKLSSKATKCPHCGYTPGPQKGLSGCSGIIIFLAAIFFGTIITAICLS